MRFLSTLSYVLFLTMGLSCPAAAQNSKVVVELPSQVSATQISKLREQLGVTSVQRLPSLQSEVWTLSTTDPKAATKKLSQWRVPAVDAAAADYKSFFASTAPALSPSMQARLDGIEKSPFFKSVQVKTIQFGDLAKSLMMNGLGLEEGFETPRSFNFNPRSDLKQVATQISASIRPDGRVHWEGALSGADTADANGEAILLMRGRSVFGTFTNGLKSYLISPLGDGLHAVSEIDQSQLPPDHPAAKIDGDAHLPPPPSAQFDAAPAAPSASAVISILVAYTPEAERQILGLGPDVQDYIENAIDLANAGMSQSKIPAQVALAGTLRLAQNETGDWSADINSLVGRSDHRWDEVHAARKQNHANVVIVLVGDEQACGLSAEIGAHVETAFALVSAKCALANHSLAHELGHLLGARHDEYADPTGTPYAWGHGYIHGSDWRTIMAYQQSGPCGSCGRVNRWANPSVMFRGSPMGTPNLNYDARVVADRAKVLATFNPP